MFQSQWKSTAKIWRAQPHHWLRHQKRDMAFEYLAKFRDMLLYNMPIMSPLYSKLAYYASIMLNALTYLLCLKLCWHNRHMPMTGSIMGVLPSQKYACCTV